MATLKFKDRFKKIMDQSPLLYRTIMFYRIHGRFPNLIKPKLFNDKMTWRILFDRRGFVVWACDKLQMKAQAKSRCPEILIPETLAVFTNISEIADFDLTGDWVLKEIAGSGQVFFGNGNLDSEEYAKLETITESWELKTKNRREREWGYSQARRGYFVERRITLEDLPDYKFHTFDGVVQFVSVHYGRRLDHRHAVFTPEGILLPIKVGRETPNAETPLPLNFQKMRQFAEKLGSGIDYVRIDFYSHDGEIYFGEYTPYFASGLWKIDPPKYEEIWGEFWNLPKYKDVRAKRK